ncbi:MAG: hypothetical protein PHR19_02420 [Bacteroidales bacterium]|nr:hypothetical protein [Bacteroidales bacterium]
MKIKVFSTFYKKPLSIISPTYRRFWDICERDVFVGSTAYGTKDALEVAQMLNSKTLDDVQGDFTLIGFIK